MTCGLTIATMVFFVLDILLGSIGIMLLCLGIWISVDIGTVFQLLAQVSSTTVTSNLLGNTGCILIALGAILICLSAFGGGAVIKERRQCITVFSVLLGAAVIVELICAILVITYSSKLVRTSKVVALDSLLVRYHDNFMPEGNGPEGIGYTYAYHSNDSFSRAVDSLQLQFTCCGVNNYTDYGSERDVPPSCCEAHMNDKEMAGLLNGIWTEGEGLLTVANRDCPRNSTYLDDIPGCLEILEWYISGKSIIFQTIGGVTAAVEVMLVVLSCFIGYSDDEIESYGAL